MWLEKRLNEGLLEASVYLKAEMRKTLKHFFHRTFSACLIFYFSSGKNHFRNQIIAQKILHFSVLEKHVALHRRFIWGTRYNLKDPSSRQRTIRELATFLRDVHCFNGSELKAIFIEIKLSTFRVM